ncbi:LAGLIDADG family homing endonuclease [Kitasatospora sp. NPDC047058]|uniref:LAGLIDADG family homing endonuclease n=1 Tax=Kitasatospora sp. NPDC047058 TaxID=3155620 RepID=UPI0033D2683C
MTFFDLERPDHAYLFAFLQADGHLTQGPGNKGRLTVELSARDAPILDEFQRLCPYNSRIRHRTRSTNFKADHTSAMWTVCAREFREELQALGLPAGRKSEIVAPPRVPFSERDYLRGLIDADGSVGRTSKGLPFVGLTTKSDAIAAFFTSYVEHLTGSGRRIFRRNNRDGIYNVVFTREEAAAVLKDLYHPGCLALPRKQAAALQAATWVRPAGMKKVTRRSWSKAEDDILMAAPSTRAAARQLGRTEQSCNLRRWRLNRSRSRTIAS